MQRRARLEIITAFFLSMEPGDPNALAELSILLNETKQSKWPEWYSSMVRTNISNVPGKRL